MSIYYSTIVAITVTSIILMMVIIASDSHLDKKTRLGYIFTFLSLIVVTAAEYVSVLLHDNFAGAIKLRGCVKFVELSIAPLVPLILANTLLKIKKTKKVMFELLLLINVLFGVISIFFKGNLYMDNPQDYYHSFYYNVYIIISILSILFMITVVWKFSKQYQNGKGYMLVLIATFILVGIIYQTINPEIKIQRLIGSMSITYIYLYHNGLIYYVDGLTQLLNQRSFLNYTSNLKCISTIIIFDIDDFKALNDKYGHQYGNECLARISKMIKDCYGKYGLCYRIGGDEFAVVITDKNIRLEKLNLRFEKMRKNSGDDMPQISIGHAYFNPEYDEITDVIEMADSNMYSNKRRKEVNG